MNQSLHSIPNLCTFWLHKVCMHGQLLLCQNKEQTQVSCPLTPTRHSNLNRPDDDSKQKTCAIPRVCQELPSRCTCLTTRNTVRSISCLYQWPSVYEKYLTERGKVSAVLLHMRQVRGSYLIPEKLYRLKFLILSSDP